MCHCFQAGSRIKTQGAMNREEHRNFLSGGIWKLIYFSRPRYAEVYMHLRYGLRLLSLWNALVAPLQEWTRLGCTMAKARDG